MYPKEIQYHLLYMRGHYNSQKTGFCTFFPPSKYVEKDRFVGFVWLCHWLKISQKYHSFRRNVKFWKNWQNNIVWKKGSAVLFWCSRIQFYRSFDSDSVLGAFFFCFVKYLSPWFVHRSLIFVQQTSQMETPNTERKCCGFMSLRTGCIIIGALDILMWTLSFLAVRGSPGILLIIAGVLLIVGAVTRNLHWMWLWIVLNIFVCFCNAILVLMIGLRFPIVTTNYVSDDNTWKIRVIIEMVFLVICSIVFYRMYVVCCYMKRLFNESKFQKFTNEAWSKVFPNYQYLPASTKHRCGYIQSKCQQYKRINL